MLYYYFMGKNDSGLENLLSLGNEYYKEIYTSSPIGIELFDENGMLLHANPACLHIFGVSKVEDILGFKLFSDPNLPADARQRLQNGETVALSESFSFDIVRKDGLYPTSKSGVIYLNTLVTALKVQGSVRGYLVQVQDVTTQKRAAEQLEAYQHQLERIVEMRTDQLEHANLQLQRELRERRRIASVEHKQRVLAEALRDTAIAISSTLSLADVMDQILSYIERVVRFDAMILLMVEDGHVWQERCRNLSDTKLETYSKDERIPIQKFSNLVLALSRKDAVVIPFTHDCANWVWDEDNLWIASNITMPILLHDVVIGFINLYSKEAGYYSEEDVAPLKKFANQAAIAIQNARLYESVQHLAIVDELTGLYNRRGLYELGMREVSRVQRFKRPMTALFFDIDHFKQFNDRYSYAVGDQVLRFLAESLRAHLRDVDILSRYGGEEFVALLPEISLEEGIEIAERLRANIEQAGMNVGKEILHITVSIGVAPLIARPNETAQLAGREPKLLHELIEKAGGKLHEAKESGRNRVAF